MPTLYLERRWTDAPEGLGPRAGILITQFPALVGRQRECNPCLNDPLISRRHCGFFVCDDQVWVEDLGSRNGTRLNGEPLKGARRLRDGDSLTLADRPFQVRLGTTALTPGPELEASVATSEAAEPPQHVLVVEDNEAVAEALARLLTQWGHDVQVAHDGLEAIQAARAQPPDTVLLDLCLPGMDGYQVAEQLRVQAGLDAARVVAITGDEPQENLAWSRQVGIHHRLVKPIDPAQLQDVLHAPSGE
jgi:CheY-like chemotaxis protein